MTRPDPRGTAADLLSQFFTDDDLRAGFADGGTIEVHVTPEAESLCRGCMSPITLTDDVWATDSGSVTCRAGGPHQPMGGAA